MAIHENEARRYSVKSVVENANTVKYLALGNAVLNFEVARQIEMANQAKLKGADEYFLGLSFFALVVSGIFEAIKRAELKKVK